MDLSPAACSEQPDVTRQLTFTADGFRAQKRTSNTDRKRHPWMLFLFARLPGRAGFASSRSAQTKTPPRGGAVGALRRSAQLATGEAEASEDKTYKCEGAGFWDGSGFPI